MRKGLPRKSSTINQDATLPAGVDLANETVITGRVIDGAGRALGGASVRLRDSAEEFTAELTSSASGDG